jgi:putative acyl-CoA dehydrogenase
MEETSFSGTCATHRVFNQTPPLENYNVFRSDRALVEAFAREGAPDDRHYVETYGDLVGRPETIALGSAANRNPPSAQIFDRFGNRRDEVEFHPAWHELLTIMVKHGLHARPWSEERPGLHVARAACTIIHAQIEAGTQCPITMTYGSVPVIRRDPDLAPIWMPRILSRTYDRRFAPITEKAGALIGMGMTEKQGGSDVRANTTQARRTGPTSRQYTLVGHKWFFSAPMCDAFLVLAQAPGGLSCYFVPRFLPDGTQNEIHIQRLKDKLGNRSNASSEVEFTNAQGWLLGEEGRGVPIILEMGTYTRLDCALGSAGMMRQAVAQAVHHAHHRAAFGKLLDQQPLMQSVLADMAVESEAATALVMRLARAFDAHGNEADALFARVVTPIAKYWICKRAIPLVAEAMEVLGGNGYVEESVMPRLYRETPLNSIWEGSGNIMCLDVLRALHKSPDALSVLMNEIGLARAASPRLAQFVDSMKQTPIDHLGEASARRMVERLAVALQASLLIRFAPSAASDLFLATRFGDTWTGTFGALAGEHDVGAIIARASPIDD